MNNAGCCFTGHRIIPSEYSSLLIELLKNTIRELYSQNGIKTVYAGGAVGFDTLASSAVLDVRREFQDIRLVIVLPNANQVDHWSAADEVICLADHYYTGCMFVRNRYLVDHSSLCVSYQTKQTGGTAYTVKYALKKGIKVINLADIVKNMNEGDS